MLCGVWIWIEGLRVILYPSHGLFGETESMDLFIVKERLKQSLWLMGPCVIGIAGLAWYRWREADAATDASAFLLPALLTGALALAWVVLLIVFLVSLKVLKREGPPPRNRFENLPWWTLKILFLVVVIVVMTGVISRLSSQGENEFTLLQEGRLERLEEYIAAHPEALEHMDKKTGKTLLELARQSGDVSVIDLLLSNGAELGVTAEEQGLAMALNNLPLFEVLLRHGADPDILDANGFAPIHYALDAQMPEAVAALLKVDADINVRTPLYQTPLMLAIMADDLPMAEALLEAGADPNQWDKRGDTALHKAVQRRNIKAVRFLLEKGTDSQVFNFANMAPIHIAVFNGQNNLVEFFCEDPGMVTLCNEDGRTPFDHALRGRRYSTARLLLGYGADIDRVMQNGYTATHLMAIGRDFQTVRFLIGEGADVHIASIDGETAHDHMRKKKMQTLLDLVEARDNPEVTTNVVGTVELP